MVYYLYYYTVYIHYKYIMNISDTDILPKSLKNIQRIP